MEWEYQFSEISGLGDSEERDHKAVLTRTKALGKQGWEMVTVTSYRGKLWAVYKRPVEEEEEQTATRSAAKRGRRVPPRPTGRP